MGGVGIGEAPLDSHDIKTERVETRFCFLLVLIKNHIHSLPSGVVKQKILRILLSKKHKQTYPNITIKNQKKKELHFPFLLQTFPPPKKTKKTLASNPPFAVFFYETNGPTVSSFLPSGQKIRLLRTDGTSAWAGLEKFKRFGGNPFFFCHGKKKPCYPKRNFSREDALHLSQSRVHLPIYMNG